MNKKTRLFGQKFILGLLLFAVGTTYVSGFAFLGLVTPPNAFRIHNSSNVPYRISTSFLNGYSQNIQAVRNAFNTWSASSPINCSEVSSGEIIYVKSQYQPCSGCLAFTQYQTSGKTITSAAVTFNTEYSWSTTPNYSQYDIERVALHEIGHTMGFDHPNEADNVGKNYDKNLNQVSATGYEIMNSSVSAGTKSHALNQDELDGRNYLYPDTTVPATVTNLTWTKSSDTSVTLTWTAPGDDSWTGTVSSYDIRWSYSAISSSTFSSANQIKGPSPLSGGSTQTLGVYGIDNTQLRYFALKAMDEAYNTSGMSNVITIDLIKPSSITDLTVTNVGIHDVQLQWTAPGDDGSRGKAMSYDIRYSTSLITGSNFSSATQVLGIASPQTAGSAETVTVQELSKNTTYYFAIKTFDEAENTSSISNIKSTITLQDTDDDGLPDPDEIAFGSNPNMSDTDGDGANDLYEFLAGTDPNNSQSFSKYLLNDNFNDGNANGWNQSGATSNIWSVTNSSLKTTVSETDGYSYFSISNLDISEIPNMAISYDVTFSNNAVWGGFWFRGIHCDINPSRCGWRDTHSTYLQNKITGNAKHHVLLLIRSADPYYLSDLYVDGKPIFLNEPIESTWKNNTVGFVSSYTMGTVLIHDNLIIWPLPNEMLAKLMIENFTEESYGAWIVGGNTNIQWGFDGKTLKVKSLSSGTGYGYFKHALLDLEDKDLRLEYDVKYSASDYGGIVYRGIYCDINPKRVGWRDDTYTYTSNPFSADNNFHHVILFIKANHTYGESTLYIDNNPSAVIGQNTGGDLIETNSYPDSSNLIGLVSPYYSSTSWYDNFELETVEQGENLSPVLLKVGDKVVKADNQNQYKLYGIDAEGVDLDYSVTPHPAWISLDDTGNITANPSLSDAGVYDITYQVSDGEKTDEEKAIIIVTNQDAQEGIVFEDPFDDGDMGNWTENDSKNNVSWNVVSGRLQAHVDGVNYGYSYLTANDVDLSLISNVVVEGDLYYGENNVWGGIYYRGVHLDLNPSRVGWRDSNAVYAAGISANSWHHFALFVDQNTMNSILYVDGKEIIKEPVETTFKNNTIGFVSGYYEGILQVDNLKVMDQGQIKTPTPLLAYYDFGGGTLEGWIGSGSTTNINWSITNGQLRSTVVSTGGYAYLWPYAMDIANRSVEIEFDMYHSSVDWGGLYYRGIHLDINPNRIGWRDNSQQKYAGISANVTHHVKLTIRPSTMESDLVIDGQQIFTNEPIETSTFKNNSIGFASNYYQGYITIDNFLINEI